MPVSGRTLLIPLGLTAAAALASACGDDETTTDTNAVTTSVTVQPSEFLGTLPCGDIEGAARSYTARVFDLDAEEGADPTIGQSGRVSCANPLAFTSVIVGHRYAAEIEIFDVLVRDLSRHALQLHLEPSATPAQAEASLGLVRRPVVDAGRYQRVWNDKVLALRESYRMND